MSSATLLRLATKIVDGPLLFPDCVSGWSDVAGYESHTGIGASDCRSHALKHIVAKHEVVKEGHSRMTHDQGCEHPCADFMRKMKCGPQHLIPGHERGNPPPEQSEWTPAENRGEQACRRLAQEQRVKTVLTQSDRAAVQTGHMRGKGRQARVGQPPSQAKRRNDPNGHANRSVNLKQNRREVALPCLGERV
jgi:hypothetical protein